MLIHDKAQALQRPRWSPAGPNCSDLVGGKWRIEQRWRQVIRAEQVGDEVHALRKLAPVLDAQCRSGHAL